MRDRNSVTDCKRAQADKQHVGAMLGYLEDWKVHYIARRFSKPGYIQNSKPEQRSGVAARARSEAGLRNRALGKFLIS